MQIQQPVMEAYGESKSNTDVFRLLAKAMGFDEPAFTETDEEMITTAIENQANPYLDGITYEVLEKKKYLKANVKPLLPGKLRTPSGKIELYSTTMLKAGLPPLPTFVPLIDDGDFPLLFIPAPAHNFLNSTFSNNDKHINLEKEPKLHMNKKDALSRNIKDGDFVRVWNNRGECELKAAVGESVLPGVVVTQGLWSNSPGTKAFANSLTPDRLADMGGGATFFSGRVDVVKMI